MNPRRKTTVLVLTFAGVLAVYLVFFTGLVTVQPIGLQWRPLALAQDGAGRDHAVVQVSLSRAAALTAIDLVDVEARDDDAPVWSVRRTARSPPLDLFVVGTALAGLSETDPAAPRPRLRPGRRYRLTVRAGRASSSIEIAP